MISFIKRNYKIKQTEFSLLINYTYYKLIKGLFIATRRSSWKPWIPIIGRSWNDDLAILSEVCVSLHPISARRSNSTSSWPLIGDKGGVLASYMLPCGGNCVTLELMSPDAKYDAMGEGYTRNFRWGKLGKTGTNGGFFGYYNIVV